MTKNCFSKAHSSTLKTLKKIALLAGAGALASTGFALHFEPTDDLIIDIDTTLAYGAMWRVEDRHEDMTLDSLPPLWDGVQTDLGGNNITNWAALEGGLNSTTTAELASDTEIYRDYIEIVNGNDGNMNFDKGDMVSNRVAAITDMDFNYKNVGLFLRTQIFYDSVYFEETSWASSQFGIDYSIDNIADDLTACGGVNADLGNACGYWVGPESENNLMAAGEFGETGRISDPSHFSEAVKETHGFNARFLDAYIYGTFDIGERLLDLRIGRQVISWGESLMLQGGVSFAQNRIDAVAATSPGVELKEIFLPTGSVYGQIDLTDSLTLEAYWMYEWLPSEIMMTGSYFAAQDFIAGSDIFILGTQLEGACANSQFRQRGSVPGPDGQGDGERSCGVYEYVGGGVDFASGMEHSPEFAQGNALQRAEDVTPDREYDQFGIAFRYLLENGSEFGFYHMRYHDRFPSVWAMNNGAVVDMAEYDNGPVGGNPSGAPLGVGDTTEAEGLNGRYYTLEYKEAIRLYGVTLNTVIGDVQMGFEVTYRPNQPVVPGCTDEMLNSGTVKNPIAAGSPHEDYLNGLNFESDCKDPSAKYFATGAMNRLPLGPGENLWQDGAGGSLLSWPTRAEVFTYNIGATLVVPPTPLWDTGIAVAEFGGVYVGGYENEDLRTSSLGGFTKRAYGVSGIFLPEWKNVVEGIDLTAPVFVNYTIDGSFSYFSYNEKSLWWSVGLSAIYLSNTTFGVTYSSFHGASNMWRDRDNIAFNIKYTF